MSFDWQTEDENEWPREVERPSHPQRIAPRRAWLFFAVVVIGLGLLGWSVYRQAQQRATVVMEEVERDVAAAHRVVVDAAQRQDVELFRALLSGRDQDWTGAQTELVTNGAWLDRAGLGLTPLHDPDPVLTTTVSAMLDAAEVSFMQDYTVQTPAGVTETVALRQTAVYRLGGQSWLYAPPLRDFWGAYTFYQGQRLAISYPQRDEAIALRLGRDLDVLLQRACAELRLDCPADQSLTLRLENDAAALLRLANWRAPLQSEMMLALPAPSLVGLPMDDAGYQALYRGYARQTLTAFIAGRVGFECCLGAAPFFALLDAQLAALALQPPPAYDPVTVLDAWQESTLVAAWNGNRRPADEINQMLYALVDYVQRTVAEMETPADAQRLLAQNQRYDDWLTAVSAADEDRGLFYSRFLQQLAAQINAAAPPAPLPAETVRLICHNRVNDGVYHYNPRAQTWQRGFTLENEIDRTEFSSYIAPLDALDAYAVHHLNVGATDERLRVTVTLWRDGAPWLEIERMLDRNSGGYNVGYSDPTGRFLVGTWFEDHPRYELFDLAECDQDGCPARPRPIPGRPIWSPDGRYALLAVAPLVETPALPMIYLADAAVQTLTKIERGRQPLWLDEARFLYTRLSPQSQPPLQMTPNELVTAVAGDETPTVLLHADELLSLLPQGDGAQPGLNLWPIRLQGDGPARVIFSLSTWFNEGGLAPEQALFSLTLNADNTAVSDVSFLTQVSTDDNWLPSPDGRYVTMYNFRNSSPRTPLQIVDTVSGESSETWSSGFSFSWSPDGRWLALVQENRLTLLLPGSDYRHIAFHNFNDCWQLSWQDEP